MVLQGFILLGNEWIDFGPFIDPENAFNWVASASDALGTHVMAWPFFAMEGAALLGGETRLPVRQFASDESAGVWRCWQCRNANFDEWPKCDTCGAGRD